MADERYRVDACRAAWGDGGHPYDVGSDWADLLVATFVGWFEETHDLAASPALEGDRGSCPYYLRCLGVPGYEDGICGFGCREEPACVTCEPASGWDPYPSAVFGVPRPGGSRLIEIVGAGRG